MGCEAKKDNSLTTPPTPPIPEYTVTFNTDGGSTIASVKVKQGNKLTKPTDPTKNDYIFKGWYKEDILTTLFDFTIQTITDDITIYAKWKKLENLSFSTTSVVSSIQLEMNSSIKITDIGAVIRLATEDAPIKTEAEASAGYVNLRIDSDSTRKFSISQHYTTNFDDGLTLDDVLAPNTAYKLYLFFDTNTIDLSEINIKGATLTNGVVVLPFTTATLPAAGDDVWARSLAGEQFVGSLPEWSYSENQKGVFVAYAQLLNNFTSVSLTIRTVDDILKNTLGTAALSAKSDPLFLFGFSKLGDSYPDNYYYMIATEKKDKISGNIFRLETVRFSEKVNHQVPLNRY